MKDQKMILLIEDNEDDVLLTIRAIKKNHSKYQIIVVKDGVEALDYLFGTAESNKNHNPLPALILLDLNLPKIDGLKVLKRIRGDMKTKNIPTVMLTSSIEEKDVTSSYSLGINSYIRKPVDFEKFVDLANIMILYWLELNESPFSNS